MNILLITNDILREFHENYINAAWTKAKQNDKSKKLSFTTISSISDYTKTRFKTLKPDYVFIYNHLNWNKAYNQGYEIAEEIIFEKLNDSTVFLKFLYYDPDINILLEQVRSLKEKDNAQKICSYISSFEHINTRDTLGNIFECYSTIHFDLLKTSYLSPQGRLVKIEHDLANWNAANSDVNNLISQIDSLEIYSSYDKENELKKLKERILQAKSNKKKLENICTDTIALIKKIIAVLNEENDDKKERKGKYPYKVFIVEDDSQWRDTLSKAFGEIFHIVYPGTNDLDNYDIAIITEKLKACAKDYDVFILDLWYEKDGKILPYNGLDIYQLVSEIRNRHNLPSVFRFVTSMPRDIFGRMVKKYFVDKNITPGHILSKKYGPADIVYSIKDRAEEISLEYNALADSLAFLKKMPAQGIFKNSPAAKSYTLEALERNHSEWQSIVKTARDWYNLFKAGNYTEIQNNKLWNNGETPSPKNRATLEKEDFKKYLFAILTLRLITIDYFVAFNTIKIGDFKTKINRITKKSNIVNLVNEIGFSFQAKPPIGDKTENEIDETTFEIRLTNLFPHEIAFWSERLAEKESNINSAVWPDAIEFLRKLYCEDSFRDNYREILQDFDPYFDVDSKSINPDFLSVESLISIVRASAEQYHTSYGELICEGILDNYIGKEKQFHLPECVSIPLQYLIDLYESDVLN